MTPLERARLVASRYPASTRAHGGIRVDGVEYIWDPVRNNLYSAAGLKAEQEAEREHRRAERAKVKQTTLLELPSMIELITSQGWRIEMSDDRLVLHNKKTDELREFACFEDAHASVMADLAKARKTC